MKGTERMKDKHIETRRPHAGPDRGTEAAL